MTLGGDWGDRSVGQGFQTHMQIQDSQDSRFRCFKLIKNFENTIEILSLYIPVFALKIVLSTYRE